MKPRKEAQQSENKAPGAFLSDGSFNEDADIRHRGHIDGLVRALVGRRRSGSLSLPLAVRAIEAGNAAEAFPNRAQWATCTHWALAWSSTSAEATVVYEGRCAVGHWCGQRYAPGQDSDCPEATHRIREPAPPELWQMLKQLDAHVTLKSTLSAATDSVEKAPSAAVRGKTATPMAPTSRYDETWPGWARTEVSS